MNSIKQNSMKLVDRVIKHVLMLTIALNSYQLIGQIGISTDSSSPEVSAILDVNSTTKGVLIPRITDAQRNILSSTAATGLLVFSTDQNLFFFYNGSNWDELKSNSINDDWIINGDNMYTAISGNVGIGTNTPTQQLELTQSIKLPTTTDSTKGVIYKGSDIFLHDYKLPITKSEYQNLFLGKGNGNFSFTTNNDFRSCRLTAIGSGIFPNLTTASTTTGVGYQCLNSLESEWGNVAFGSYALNSCVSDYSNFAIGFKAAYSDTSYYGTIVGSKAMMNTNKGGTRQVIAIGYNSGSNIESGGLNIVIGNNTEFAHTNYGGQINIGNLIYGIGMETGTNLSSNFLIHIGISPISAYGLENFNIAGGMRIGGASDGDYIDMNVHTGVTELKQSDYGSGEHSFNIVIPDNANDSLIFGEFIVIGSDTNYYNNWNLLSNGNFGVLTTSPDYKLQVNGTIAPETNGQNLGVSNLKWDAYLREANIQTVNISEVIVLEPQQSTYVPTNPVEGELYVDHSHNIKCYLDGSWKTLNN